MPPKIKPLSQPKNRHDHEESPENGRLDYEPVNREMGSKDRGRSDLTVAGTANDSRQSSSLNPHLSTEFFNKSKQVSNSGKRRTISPLRVSPNRSELHASVPFFGLPSKADVDSLNNRLQKVVEENHVLTDKLSNTRRLLDRRERDFIVERQDLQLKVKNWQSSHSEFFKDLEAFKLKLKYYEELEEEVGELRKFKTRIRGNSKQHSEVLRKRADDEKKEHEAMMIRGFNGNAQEQEQERCKEIVHGEKWKSLQAENDQLREELDRNRLLIEDLEALNNKLTEKHQRNERDHHELNAHQDELLRHLEHLDHQAFVDSENMRLGYEQKLDELAEEINRLMEVLDNRERNLEDAEREIYELRHLHTGSKQREGDVDSDCEIPRFSLVANSEDDIGSRQSHRTKRDLDENEEIRVAQADKKNKSKKALNQLNDTEIGDQVSGLKSEIEELVQKLDYVNAQHAGESQRLMSIWNVKEKSYEGRLYELEMTDNMINLKAVKNTNRKLLEQVDQKDNELKKVRGLFDECKNELKILRQEKESVQTGTGVGNIGLAMAVSNELEELKKVLLATKKELETIQEQNKTVKDDRDAAQKKLEIEKTQLKIEKDGLKLPQLDLSSLSEEKKLHDSDSTQNPKKFEKILKEKDNDLRLAKQEIEKYKQDLEQEKLFFTQSIIDQDKFEKILEEKENDLVQAKEALELYQNEREEENKTYTQSILNLEKLEETLGKKGNDLLLANAAIEKLKIEIETKNEIYIKSTLNQEQLEKSLAEKAKDIKLANEVLEKYKKELEEVSTKDEKNIVDVKKSSIECAKLEEKIVKDSQRSKLLEEELKKCKELINKLTSDSLSGENSIKKAVNDLSSCKKDLEKRSKELEACKHQLEASKSQLEDSEMERKKVEASLAVDKRAAISESRELQEMSLTNSKLERALVRLKLENEDLRSGKVDQNLLLEIESHIRDLKKEVGSLRAGAKTKPSSHSQSSNVHDIEILQHKYEAILTAHQKLIKETSGGRHAVGSEGNRRRSSSPNISSHRSPTGKVGDQTKMSLESSDERIAQLESWLDEIYSDQNVVVHQSTQGKKMSGMSDQPASDQTHSIPALPELKHSGLAQNRWRNRAVAGRASYRPSYEPKPAWDARKTK